MSRIIAAVFAAPLLLSSTAVASDVVTSFEFVDTSGSFTLGFEPKTVTFTGGSANATGIPSLVKTGMNAWIISGGTTGTIQFDVPAEDVTLSFRDQFLANASTLTVFDELGQALLLMQGTTSFQDVTLSATGLGAPIDKITLQSQGALGVSVVDDLTYQSIAGTPIADPIPGPIPVGPISVQLVSVVEGLIAPNWGIAAPVGDRLFVTDQVGVVWALDVATGDKVEFLDVTAQLVPLGVSGPNSFDERGLLGVAFHPNYASNGLLYTYTSEPAAGGIADFSTLPVGANPNHHAVITEWKVQSPMAEVDASNPASLVDPGSERELMRIAEPQFNHDGGCVNFGPDGRLYISLGDGGASDDQGNGHAQGGNGQDPGNILGTILRIDPLGTNSTNGRYGIPLDNPFIGNPAFLNEIYAYGFRNPFRFSFDTMTGDLYCADVGQNDIEEVDIVTSGQNYGWPCKEGSFYFDQNPSGPGFVTTIPPHGVPPGLVDPIAEYDHDEGIAIIGGFVYRGSAMPQLFGRYVFGEFAQTFSSDGRLFHLDANGDVVEFPLVGKTSLSYSILGFAEHQDGEIYVLANTTGIPFPDSMGQPTGVVLRITPESPFVDLGHAKMGSNGQTPHLAGTGPATIGSNNTVTLTGALPNSPFLVVAGANNVSLPALGGTLVPSVDIVIPGSSTDAAGSFTAPFVWPVVPAGIRVYGQFLIADPGVSFGISMSNGLQMTGS